MAVVGLALIGLVLVAAIRGGSTVSATTTVSSYTASGSTAMSFAVLDQSASYGIPSYDDQAVQQADLSMLLSTGAQCVRVDIGYGPWLSNDQATISLITSVVNSIRSAGRCLIIADASSESYRNGGGLPWSQFKVAWVSRVQTLAALYHPDYYIVVKEPGWYVPMVSDSSTNPEFQNMSDWVALTQNLTSAVLSSSPGTKVGVAIAADSLNSDQASYTAYLNQVQAIPGLSFIGFDVYTSTGQTAAETYLSQNPPTKDVWISEAWRADGAQIYYPVNAQPDAQWMKSIYQFAQSIGAKMLIPFYTDLFSGYTVPTDSSSMVAFYQGRTPAYTEFKNVVSGNP